MIERLEIPEVFLYTPERFPDGRGYFTETFNQARLTPYTGALAWVQDNQSFSAAAGTLRGLHFQAPPHAQDKLVRCASGRMLDVAVDIRRGSPTFGRHVRAELDAATGRQMFIPKGFAHAFLTLEPGCEVAYKVTSHYNREAERSIAWNDSDLGVDWGLAGRTPALSEKDAAAPRFAALPAYFHYSD